MNTVLFHWNADNLAQQGLSDEAGFGMSAGGRGKRTAVAADEVPAFALFESRGTAEVLEGMESQLDPLVPGFAFDGQEMVVRDSSSYFAHRGAQFLWTELF